MAQDIVGGLFGIDPAVLQQQRYEADAGEALSFANLNPQQQGQYAMYRAGQMFGGDVFPRLAGAENPQMRQARQMQQVKQWIASNNIDMSTAEGLSKAAEYARQNNMVEGAYALGQAAIKARLDEATITQKMREKVGSPESQAEQVRYNQLVNALGEERGAMQFLAEKEASKRNVAAAGAAQYGGEKIANLSGAQNIVEGYTKKPMERLQAIGEAQTYLGQAGVNSAAVPQLRRALVKLGGGDSQVAMKEVQQIAGSMGIAGNVAEAVNQFFTGTPTNEQLKLIGQVVKGAETYYAGQYSKGRQQAENVLGAAKLDPQTRAALLPPEYKLPEQKKQSTGKKTISFSDLPQ